MSQPSIIAKAENEAAEAREAGFFTKLKLAATVIKERDELKHQLEIERARMERARMETAKP